MSDELVVFTDAIEEGELCGSEGEEAEPKRRRVEVLPRRRVEVSSTVGVHRGLPAQVEPTDNENTASAGRPLASRPEQAATAAGRAPTARSQLAAGQSGDPRPPAKEIQLTACPAVNCGWTGLTLKEHWDNVHEPFTVLIKCFKEGCNYNGRTPEKFAHHLRTHRKHRWTTDQVTLGMELPLVRFIKTNDDYRNPGACVRPVPVNVVPPNTLYESQKGTLADRVEEIEAMRDHPAPAPASVPAAVGENQECPDKVSTVSTGIKLRTAREKGKELAVEAEQHAMETMRDKDQLIARLRAELSERRDGAMDFRIAHRDEVLDLRRQLEATRRKETQFRRDSQRLREERDRLRRRPAATVTGAAETTAQRGTDLRQVRAGQPLAVFPREDLSCRWYRLASADLSFLQLANRSHLTDQELGTL